MSIPLDRLYHFIEDIAKEIKDNVIIYRFWPHGSKKLIDLGELTGPISWQQKTLNFSIYCHDQEPLNYKLYQNCVDNDYVKTLKSMSEYIDDNLITHPTIYDHVCLIHSEKRSNELIRYQAHSNHKFIDVYYWCHAVIALDWFRYAQHLEQKKQVEKTFLIYNRAWSGTREYRLKFAELLIKLNLQDCCRATINPVEPEVGIHYSQHQFKNPAWRPYTVLEDHFPISVAQSHYSADFDIKDYEATDIEVVLETLFDDSRLHLTEKSLRPVACGQPFIFAGTHGSLEYLRSYGFRTFGDVWDESYDNIKDPRRRLQAIADLMQQISIWSPEVRKQKMAQAQIITQYNKKLFFSAEFFNLVVKELTDNLKTAIDRCASEPNTTVFVQHWKKVLGYKEMQDYLTTNSNINLPILDAVKYVLEIAKKSTKT